jgi:hypothetical protein
MNHAYIHPFDEHSTFVCKQTCLFAHCVTTMLACMFESMGRYKLVRLQTCKRVWIQQCLGCCNLTPEFSHLHVIDKVMQDRGPAWCRSRTGKSCDHVAQIGKGGHEGRLHQSQPGRPARGEHTGTLRSPDLARNGLFTQAQVCVIGGARVVSFRGGVLEELSSYAAGAIATRARKLLRRGDLTHRDLILLDCLLWSCRQKGRGVVRVSYTRLQQLARVARSTVADGLLRLEAAGLLIKQKTRIRVNWGLGTASRQGTNLYRLIAPSTESKAPTVKQKQDSKIQELPLATGLAAALARLERALERRGEGDAPGAGTA